MIDHTGVSISNPVRARRFYEQALAPLGYKVLMEVPVEFTGGVMVLGMGVPPKPDFWSPGHAAEAARPHRVPRRQPRREYDAFYTAALAAGGGPTTGRLARGPTTTRTTTVRSCSIRTATTSRPVCHAPASPA